MRPLCCLTLFLALSGPAAHAASLTHGPLIGNATGYGMTVWIRADQAAAVQVDYGQDPTLATSSRSDAYRAESWRDFTVAIDLTRLVPGTWYYRVVLDGIVDPRIYRFDVVDRGTAPFTFVVLSDFAQRSAPVFARVEALDPDFVLIGGDLGHTDLQDLDAMRNRHQILRSDGTEMGTDFKSWLIDGPKQWPIYHVWDDHDYGANDGDRHFPGKQDALRAFREYFVTANAPDPDGIWQSFRWGQAEFFLLDSRSQRDKAVTPKTMLGDRQLRWLAEGLARSTAHWKFVLSPVTLNPTTAKWDAWYGFAVERAELLDLLRRSGNVVVLSGDLHTGGAFDDGTRSGVPELSSPHGNLHPTQDSTAPGAEGTWTWGPLTGIDNPGLARITVERDRVEIEVLDPFGVVRYATEVPDCGAKCRRRLFR